MGKKKNLTLEEVLAESLDWTWHGAPGVPSAKEVLKDVADDIRAQFWLTPKFTHPVELVPTPDEKIPPEPDFDPEEVKLAQHRLGTAIIWSRNVASHKVPDRVQKAVRAWAQESSTEAYVAKYLVMATEEQTAKALIRILGNALAEVEQFNEYGPSGWTEETHAAIAYAEALLGALR